ncbi:iron-sulfur cluster repair di-iron protein [Chitinophaga filiformis]|uniref:Regulator of cell morphogenesis and NO signaling n=1 Tax=Chitinophaga filiformis TaxID=104663 RepID=A0A1G8CVA4_CHIFI|nr:iron-sulfur cluster repair di-iron protein [Chitinophaga filiformis]SDH49396.1 regulator of cell morphogenesis and NO signaling [Chitinophaga filiformis]
MNTTRILDVPTLAPAVKHQTIIEAFDALLPGEEFIIHNDHDPKPLYYELISKKGNIVTFDYLENGPSLWRVLVKKRDAHPDQVTVADMAAADYRKADVFAKHGIDFCCGGNITLKEAARRRGIDEAILLAELDKVTKEAVPATEDYINQDLHILINHIVGTHHQYVRENAPIIEQLAVKVARRHGKEHPELAELETGTIAFLDDLQQHLEKEERILFPAIVQLEELRTKEASPAKSFILSAIKVMRAEHDTSGEDLRTFRKLTNDYALPQGACNSYTLLFEKMKAFEADLLRHIHLENNILFPKAVQLEQALS